MTISKKITKLISTGCFIATAGLMFSACGADDNKAGNNGETGECKATEQKATVNGKSACYEKCSNGVCSGGATCMQGICIGGAGNNGTPNNGTTPNNETTNPNNETTNPNNETTNPNNETTNPNNGTNPVDPNEKLCTDTFKKFFDTCVNEVCTVDADLQTGLDNAIAGQDVTACAANLAASPETKADFEAILAGECGGLKGTYCSGFGLIEACGCAPTEADKVGNVCTMNDECGAGDFGAGCITETFTDAQGMVQQSGFIGGYCTSGCIDTGDTAAPETTTYGGDLAEGACGVGNLCQIFVNGTNRQTLCLDGCTQHSDCRSPGYSCDASIQGDPDNANAAIVNRFCILETSCQSNADCNGLNCTDGVCDTAVFLCGDTPLDPNNAAFETGSQLCARSNGACQDIDGNSVCVLN